MSQRLEQRYWWVKISEDFFDNHKIRLIQEQEYGAEAILLFVFLLAESASHDGELRCDENTPYSIEDVGVLCRIRPESRVPAFELLRKYGLLEVDSNGTIKVIGFNNYIGSETKNAERMRTVRAQEEHEGCTGGVQGVHKGCTKGAQGVHKGCTKGAQNDKIVHESIEYRVESIDNNNTSTITPTTASAGAGARTHEGKDKVVVEDGIKYSLVAITQLCKNYSETNAIPKSEISLLAKYIFENGIMERDERISNKISFINAIYKKWVKAGLNHPSVQVSQDDVSAAVKELNRTRMEKIPKECIAMIWDYFVGNGFSNYRGEMITKANVKGEISSWWTHEYSKTNSYKETKEKDENAKRKAEDDAWSHYLLTHEDEIDD